MRQATRIDAKVISIKDEARDMLENLKDKPNTTQESEINREINTQSIDDAEPKENTNS